MSDRDNITLPREVVQRVVNGWDGDDYWSFRGAIANLETALAAEQPKQEPVAWMESPHGAIRANLNYRFNWPSQLHWQIPLYAAPPALAAEQPKPEPVESDDDEEFTRERVTTLLLEVMDWTYAQAHRDRPMTEAEQKVLDDIRTALAAPRPEPEKRHPDYVIGNHWFETAYERLCAGEAEDAILEDYEVVREPRLRDLRRDAERYRWALGWLVRTGLLSCEACRIDTPESYGNWWILRKPQCIDGRSFVAYGADLKDAIDAAMEASTAPSAAAVDASTAPEAKP